MKRIKLEDVLLYLDEHDYEYKYVGDASVNLEGFSSLKKYKPHTFTWLKKQENWDKANQDIRLIIVQEGCKIDAPNQIIAKESKKIFFSLIDAFFGVQDVYRGIGQKTVIGADVEIGEGVEIGSGCILMGDICIGRGTVIGDHVVIKNRVNIGENCRIQTFCVLGEDGFGYLEDQNHKKTMIRHYGGLKIGKNVFIGAHTNIARGVIDDTVIGDGVKIAPSSHIGHNNQIDDDAVFICSQSYGSVHIGEDAYIVGSIIRNQCSVGKHTMVGMGSVVTKNLCDNKVAMGTPARESGNRYE